MYFVERKFNSQKYTALKSTVLKTFTNAILHLNGNFYLRLLAKYQTHTCLSSYLRG